MEEKIWTKNKIRENLEKSDVWVHKAIVSIYNFQTEEEKVIEDTTEHNGVGFNGPDGHILSSFASQIIKWDKSKFKSPLSPKQMTIARKRIVKYSGQLTKIANKEI